MTALPPRRDPHAVAQRLAGQMPVADEAVVRDLVAVAGPDILGALSALTTAIGCVVAERGEPETWGAVLGACNIAMARATARRVPLGPG